MNKPSVLCEYGKATETSIFCTRSKENCILVRWCTTCDCLKNSEGYILCKVRNKTMEKIEEKDTIEEEVESSDIETETEKFSTDKDDSYIEEYCPVIISGDHIFGVDFHGFGISFSVKEENYLDDTLIGETIKVKYKGEIGKPDFEIHPVYE